MPEGSAAFQLAVGDRVVYPNQGVCRVSSIEAKEVAGQKLTFVTMHREEDGAVVMVPQTKVQSIGVRKVAGPEDVAHVFEFLHSDSDKAVLDWKQRARTNVDRMTQGGLLGLAEVVKGLQVLSELRPLPAKERELYDNARHLLVSEVAAALDTTECNAEDAIDVVLFPPGRERPKRTAAEFKTSMMEEGVDELSLDADLLGLDSDLDMPPEEEEAPSEEEEAEAGAHAAEAEEEGEPSLRKKVKSTLAAEVEHAAPKKRGRPPKPKPEGEVAAAPKKRGRPPKPKPEGEVAAAPKKRGRPPKPKPEGEAAAAAAPKKRGRPPKAKPPEAASDIEPEEG